MHSAFLYHAIQHGMNMGIVNPTMLEIYDEIEPELLIRVEDVLLNKRDDATERLLDFAEQIVDNTTERKLVVKEWRAYPLQNDPNKFIVKDAEEARLSLPNPVEVIEGAFDDWNEYCR